MESSNSEVYTIYKSQHSLNTYEQSHICSRFPWYLVRGFVYVTCVGPRIWAYGQASRPIAALANLSAPSFPSE